MPIRIGLIVPTHAEAQLHAYTMATLRSFFQYTANGLAIVVDDASDSWSSKLEQDLQQTPQYEGQSCLISRFSSWGGLTRSWNAGLTLAVQADVDYVIPANNDLLFTPGWYRGLLWATTQGYHLVGPVSNAPGKTSKGLAHVENYYPDYQVSDDSKNLAAVAHYLEEHFQGVLVDCPVNGFFQFAKTCTWVDGKYDANHFYCPRNDFNSKGKPNPTPLMTLNEDELQGRWKKKGWKTAVLPSSYVFHYRAVTRGPRFTHGSWMRRR